MNPTRKSLNYLRVLANQAASSFAHPQTFNDASVQITRLKALRA